MLSPVPLIVRVRPWSMLSPVPLKTVSISSICISSCGRPNMSISVISSVISVLFSEWIIVYTRLSLQPSWYKVYEFLSSRWFLVSDVLSHKCLELPFWMRIVFRMVCRMVPCMVCRMVCRMVSCLVSHIVSRMVSRIVSCMVPRMVFHMVFRMVLCSHLGGFCLIFI